jgi:hypothetical protein
MIKPQHDSQGKRSPDPCERRGRQTGSTRMINRNVMKFRDRIYVKKHGLDRVCATRHQQQIYFFDPSAQGSFSRFRGQAMGVYKPCRCNFKGETHKG